MSINRLMKRKCDISDSLQPPWIDLPNSGVKPMSLALQTDSLPAKPQGKLKNTGVGSLSLLQQSYSPRNRTWVSCIGGGFFTNLAIREAHIKPIKKKEGNTAIFNNIDVPGGHFAT